jgi:GNAT superfamily N-acetyltransferase
MADSAVAGQVKGSFVAGRRADNVWSPTGPHHSMQGEIVLRLATRADIPHLNPLIAESARRLSRGFYDDHEVESAIRYVFGVDTGLIEDRTYYVASLNGAVAGCGGWSRRNTLYGGDQRPVGTPSFLDPATEPARLRAFFVAPSAARRGVGRRLYEECVEAARAAGFRSLTLMATLPGVPFYATLGFETVEEVTDLLPDGCPLRFVRMMRSLDTDPH